MRCALRVVRYTYIHFVRCTENADGRGGWRIEVNISDDAITVTHIRLEQSWSSDAGEHWQFEWKSKLEFNRDASELLAVRVMIQSVQLQGANEEIQQIVLDALSPIISMQ